MDRVLRVFGSTTEPPIVEGGLIAEVTTLVTDGSTNNVM
jgi:hypothetical protein